jgi:hypothetical protein
VEASEPWKADNNYDEYWGADETDYWAQKDAEIRALAKLERPVTTKPHTRHINQLIPEIIEWEQPGIQNTALMSEIEEAHKTPLPITYTAISSSTDMSRTQNKRRLFGNLHRQFAKEIEKAKEWESWLAIPPEVWHEAQGHASKPCHHWEEMDIILFEPRIRELVRLLIAKRREAELL